MDETFVCLWCGRTFGESFRDFGDSSLCKFCSGEIEEDKVVEMKYVEITIPREEWLEKVENASNSIYLVMNRPSTEPGFPVAAFLTLLQAQQYMISAHTSGRPKGVKGLGICEMKLVSEDPVRYAWGDAMLPLARKNKKDCSLLEQGVITLLENEEPVEKDTKGEDE